MEKWLDKLILGWGLSQWFYLRVRGGFVDIVSRLSWDGLDHFGFIQSDKLDRLKHGEMVR